MAVAVATIDRPDRLARCLSGILSGEVLPRELVVVDQGADPRAQHVLAGYQVHSDVSLRHIRQARLGLSASRNIALRCTTSPILAVTDDDCVPDSRWLAAIAWAFETSPRLAAVTGPVLPIGSPREGDYAVSSRTSMMRAQYSGYAPPWEAGTGGNTAVRREWLNWVGGYDERLGAGSPGGAAEDIDLIYRLLRGGAQIRYEPGAVVRHERQPAERRLSTRKTYGRGVGALCGLLLREGDLTGGRLLLMDWSRLRLRRLLGAAWRGRSQRAYEECLVLWGTIAGFGYGVSVGASARSNPPPCDEQSPSDH